VKLSHSAKESRVAMFESLLGVLVITLAVFVAVWATAKLILS
jgi:hypothetical protein